MRNSEEFKAETQGSRSGQEREGEPAGVENERFARAMVRMGGVLNEKFHYKFVGGAWVELVVRLHSIDYKRGHDDIDVVLSDPRAVDLLKESGYSLAEGEPNAEGNREDFSGQDEQTGERVGIFVGPVDEASLLRVNVAGTELTGEPLADVYLKKLANIEKFKKTPGLVPRKKDIDDTEALRLIVQEADVEARISEEVDTRTLEARVFLNELAANQGLPALREFLSSSPLPDNLRSEVIEIIDHYETDSIQQEQAIEEILLVYKEHARKDILGSYGLNTEKMKYNHKELRDFI